MEVGTLTPAIIQSPESSSDKKADEFGGDEDLKGESKKKGPVRAALDSVGLSAVCFYLVVWLALFLFNAVCVCLLVLLVPCLWGAGRPGCLLFPACPTWPAHFAPPGQPTPI
jgi:hypothetical protein